MFNLIPSVKFSPMTLTIDDVAHTVALVCTHGMKEILGFGNWKKKIEREGGGDDLATVVMKSREGRD